MITIDMWYGDREEDITDYDCYFSDADCEYRGNLYIGNKFVGDFTAETLQEVWERFGRR